MVSEELFIKHGAYRGDGAEAVSMDLEFYFNKPKSAKKRVHVVVKPDIDKLARAILDAGTGILYGDDSQVVSLSASKRYGGPERVEIQMTYE